MFKRPMAWAVKHKKWVLVLLAGGQGKSGELKRSEVRAWTRGIY